MANLEYINVLDHGYVIMHKADDEIEVARAARVSYDKPAFRGEDGQMMERDHKLINFLAREKHTSPFRHVNMTFEVYAPLFVARQWWKHAVGAASIEDGTNWNESSRRYVTEEPLFYVPKDWRLAPENSKQGSGADTDKVTAAGLTNLMDHAVRVGLENYESALDSGIAPEQARLFLPAYAMYVRWRWTPSLAAATAFLGERLATDAQFEIRQYANAIKKLMIRQYPITMKAYGLDNA
jgi:thymidylate synthase (FAD)